jgi:hypothetical protein
MKNLTKVALSALLAGAFALGCGSSSSSGDGGDSGAAGSGDGPTLYGITMGDSCFDVTMIAANATDGCNIGVADVVNSALLVHYDPTTATLTVGTMGSLGSGVVTFNAGTLTRANDPTDSMMPTCMWHQTDTSDVTVTATNEFDISVTEMQSMFKAACTAPPAGGMCTSTWTWHMKRNPNKTPDLTAMSPCG